MRVTIKTTSTWHGAPEVERAVALAVEATAGYLQLKAEGNIASNDLIDTGEMHDSWDIERPGRFTRIVKNGVFYGQFSEYGTTREAADPWFRPALKSTRSFFRRALKAAVPGS